MKVTYRVHAVRRMFERGMRVDRFARMTARAEDRGRIVVYNPVSGRVVHGIGTVLQAQAVHVHAPD